MATLHRACSADWESQLSEQFNAASIEAPLRGRQADEATLLRDELLKLLRQARSLNSEFEVLGRSELADLPDDAQSLRMRLYRIRSELRGLGQMTRDNWRVFIDADRELSVLMRRALDYWRGRNPAVAREVQDCHVDKWMRAAGDGEPDGSAAGDGGGGDGAAGNEPGGSGNVPVVEQ